MGDSRFGPVSLLPIYFYPKPRRLCIKMDIIGFSFQHRRTVFCLVVLAFYVTSCAELSTSNKSSVRRILDVSDDVSLECLTNNKPNVAVLWMRQIQELEEEIMAEASYGDGVTDIQVYVKDERFSYGYHVYQDSEIGDKSIFTLNMSGLTRSDSANYTCSVVDSETNSTEKISVFDISVIDCNCDIGTNIVCDLDGFETDEWIPVVININGGTRKTTPLWRLEAFAFARALSLFHWHQTVTNESVNTCRLMRFVKVFIKENPKC